MFCYDSAISIDRDKNPNKLAIIVHNILFRNKQKLIGSERLTSAGHEQRVLATGTTRIQYSQDNN